MNRREFIAALGTAAALPLAARAQEAGLDHLLDAGDATLAPDSKEAAEIRIFDEGQDD